MLSLKHIYILKMNIPIDFFALSSVLIGLAFLAYFISIKAFSNKLYVFKPVEYLKGRAMPVAVLAGILYLLLALLLVLGYAEAATAMHVVIAMLCWVVFFSLFNYKKVKNDINLSKDIQEEINTRYSIEDRLINKNKQLEWAERTAKICYGNWDVKNDEIRLSDGAEDVFGVDPLKAISFEDLKAIIIPEDRIRIQRVIESLGGSREITSFLFRIIVGGKLKYVQMNSEVYDNGKSVDLIRGTFQDVTEQQMFIKRIEDKNETLKGIAWTQSHDVRGPLATIMGLLNLLNEDDFKDSQNKEIVSGLKESSLQLDEIIKKIVKKSESADVDLSQ